ncbi:MAG: hypothetical protein ACFFDD_12070 [Promethearchaeota archaeon]
MKTLAFDRQYINRVIDYLSHNYAKVTRKVSFSPEGVLAIFIHEEYVFRTGSYQTLTSIVESQGELGQATLTVVGSGGGGGICNFNWGSHSAGENTIIMSVKNIIDGYRSQYSTEDWYFEGHR